MINSTVCRILPAFAAMLFAGNVLAQQPVIPGAAGFGIDTAAGRGGDVIQVTNLKDSGQGSLRSCVETSGPRVCVFQVSGTISLTKNLTVSSPNLTIAGQTAPSPGIMLRNASLVIHASDVLVQHITIRAGDEPDGSSPMYARDTLKIIGRQHIQNIVIDHCSLSWALDEVVEVWGDWDNVTLSNNIISEPLRSPDMGEIKHGYAALVDASSGRISFVGNLFAHAHNRNPRSAAESLVFVNNVIYNAGAGKLNLFNGDGITSQNTIVGNVFIDGPSSKGILPVRLNGMEGGTRNILKQILKGTGIYLSDNVAAAATPDPWSIVLNQSDLSISLLRLSKPPVWPTGLDVMPAGNDVVLNSVLDNVGSRPGDRNTVDARVIQEVRNRTGTFISCVADDGTSSCKSNAGGWPKLASNVRQLDLPDNVYDDDNGDGYTNVEEWLQTMAAAVEGHAGSDGPSTPPIPGDTAAPKPPVLQQAQ